MLNIISLVLITSSPTTNSITPIVPPISFRISLVKSALYIPFSILAFKFLISLPAPSLITKETSPSKFLTTADIVVSYNTLVPDIGFIIYPYL